jgi:hypothetical protein
MRQLVVDQLSREEWQNLESHLKRTVRPGPMVGLFWLDVPPDLWGAAQQGHERCAPFFFSIELSEDKIIFELLVRSGNTLHCSCISYADPAQWDFLFRFIENILAEERIKA